MRFWSKAAVVAVVALPVALLTPVSSAAEPARTTTICTWGGTPAAPTGEFTVKPGLTLTPSSGPIKFRATGPLAGDPGCEGKAALDGFLHAGATCGESVIEGTVTGLPRAERVFGYIASGVALEFLYDKAGNLVGFNEVQVLTQDGEQSSAAECNTPEGFTHGLYSAVSEIFGA
jgi:hypothetical protein